MKVTCETEGKTAWYSLMPPELIAKSECSHYQKLCDGAQFILS